MAQLSDRGQLLLVGAFVLAVALIGLTVVINASTQTTTVAGNGGASVNGGDPVAAREAAERNVGSLLWTWNQGGLDTTGDWEGRFATNVSHLGNGTRTYGARRGQFVNVTVAMYDDVAERGTRLSGPIGSPLTIPPSVRARNATFLVTNVPSNADDTLNLSVTSGADEWDMYVNKSSTGDFDDVVVGTAGTVNAIDRGARQCTFDDALPVRINPGDATVVTRYGTPQEQTRYCPALDRFGSGDSFDGYGLSVTGPLAFSGEYSLLVNESGVGAPTSGSAVPVIYNATVRFRYRSPTVVYETDIRVAPDEIP